MLRQLHRWVDERQCVCVCVRACAFVRVCVHGRQRVRGYDSSVSGAFASMVRLILFRSMLADWFLVCSRNQYETR